MSKKINISIVGTGLMGLQHIKAIQKSKKASLHSIVDISNNAKNLSKKYKTILMADNTFLYDNSILELIKIVKNKKIIINFFIIIFIYCL